MKYKCRPGIVRIKICGETFLVPNRATSETVPNIMRLSLLKAAIWEDVEKGRDVSFVIQFFQALTKKPKNEIKERIDQVLDEMYEKGYLIPADKEVT